MATIPSVATLTTGNKIDSTYLASIKSFLDFTMSDKPLGFFVQQASQTGWTSATFTAVTFGASSEVIDRDTQHSTSSNTSRVVIGDTLGWYKVSGVYVPAVNSATTFVRCCIAKNGTEVNGSCSSFNPVSTSSALALPTPTVLVEATSATDYVELLGWQTAASGTIGTVAGTIISPSLTVEYVGKS